MFTKESPSAVFEPPASSECGRLGVCHLKRWWSICTARRQGNLAAAQWPTEWARDTALFDVLGVGIEQIFRHPELQNATFDDLEAWLLALNPRRSIEKIARFNALVRGEAVNFEPPSAPVLSAEQLEFWHQNGFVVIPEAISRLDALATQALIWTRLEKSPDAPESWSTPHPLLQGIMVQLFQHPQLEANRNAIKVRAAFAQLWGRHDLWVNTDRVGFNPPIDQRHSFQGHPLHWDVSLKTPIPFGLQGLIYLSDTTAEQGAFTLIPGMHRTLEAWLASLPKGTNPREVNLSALGPVPVAGQAGDLVIWHQALAHGASPNRANFPRFVQYLTWQPIDREMQDEWI